MECDKHSYKNWSLARAAANGIGAHTGASMRVYRCDICNGLHLTTSGKKRTMRAVRKASIQANIQVRKILPPRLAPPQRRATYKLLSAEMAAYLKRLIENNNKLQYAIKQLDNRKR